MATAIEYDIPAREPTPRPVAPTRSDPGDDSPVCPACGGLECLCRPRFFPGQLLTDDDLNRLQRYVVDKNRLHNRYLHGWGVVCGLEVVCDPCVPENVLVRTGYALSPCGDDIVVCRDQAVNVCKLIQECRPARAPICDPPYDQPARDCKGSVEPWVLAICYDERPSRGITALTGAGDSACGPGCACGGSGGCGCGAKASGGGPDACSGGNTQKNAAITSKPRKAYKPQCEPTLICEGYVFKAYRYKPTETNGAMEEQFTKCLTAFLEALPDEPGENASAGQLLQWCCDFKEALRGLIVSHPTYDCRLLQKLNGIACRPKSPNETRDQYIQAVLGFFLPVITEYVMRCFCLALMPPCTAPARDACVPIATLTVDTRTCAVLDICNWSSRKFATTFPSLQYWLSFLPFVRMLRDAIAKFCCGGDPTDTKTQAASVNMREGMETAHFNMTAGRRLSSRRKETGELLLRAIFAQDRVVDSQVLPYGLLGGKNADGSPMMSDIELRNPLQFLLFNQLAAPVVRGQLPEDAFTLARVLAAGFGPQVAEGAAARDEEVKELRKQVAGLQKTVGELMKGHDRR